MILLGQTRSGAMRGWRGARRALTRVELVVGLAAVAVLVAVALASRPTPAREQAKRVHCAANLKQIAEAWQKFLGANNGRFLQHVNANINFGGKQGSDPAYGGDPNRPVPKPLNAQLGLAPVTAEAKMFSCPADRGGGIAKESTHFDFYGSSGDAGWVNAWHPGSAQRIEWHQRKSSHNMAFMDGHVDFVRIRKGIHTCGDYTVIPWRDLQEMACSCQAEVLP